MLCIEINNIRWKFTNTHCVQFRLIWLLQNKRFTIKPKNLSPKHKRARSV